MKKDMKIVGEQLLFGSRPQTDAEEQVAVHQFQAKVPAGPQYGMPQGQIPGVIEYQTTAGNMANAVRTACGQCKHWSNRAWLKYMAAATGPLSKAEDRQTIEAMRARLMMAGYGPEDDAGDVDIEAGMRSFGICSVLTEWVENAVGKDPIHWPIVTAHDARCPTYVQAGASRMDVTTDAEPFGFFRPRDLDAEQHGAKRYDAVLFDAAGKIR